MGKENFQFVVAPHTPMLGDGMLNLQEVTRQARWLHQSGATGVFLGGATGEGQSLTMEERADLAERWIDAAHSLGLKHFVHVGSASQSAACELAVHARDVGSDAIVASCYEEFEPDDACELVDYCQLIGAQAPNLPFYYYHVPVLTGLRIPMASFLGEVRDKIPNLAGIVFASADFDDLQRCLTYYDLEILHAHDETLLSAYSLGVHGVVGSSYNFLGQYYLEMLRTMDTGDLATARDMQRICQQVVDRMVKVGYVPAGKQLMRLFEIECGPARTPIQNPEEADVAELIRELLRDFPECFATPRRSRGSSTRAKKSAGNALE